MSNISPVHRVRPGESLSSVAAYLLGSAAEWPRLAQANGLKPPYRIFVGQPLHYPGRGQTPARHSYSAIGAVHPFSQYRSAQARMPPSLGTADTPAAWIQYPTLNYRFESSVSAQFPGGICVLKISADLKVQQSEAFSIESDGKNVNLAIKDGGISIGQELPFKGGGITSTKIRAEYGNKLIKCFSDAEFNFNAVTGKATVEFKGTGWKFETSEYMWKLPNTHVFTFKPKPVTTPPGIRGEIKLTAETTTNDRQSQMKPISVPVRTLDLGMPKLTAEDIVAPTATALAFCAALELLRDYGILALLAL